jgi:lariat debranching enzyme
VVIIGCCHGELDAMYDSINHLQERQNIKIDLVLCCGDFQVSPSVVCLSSH